ncbi:ABC transporter permease [Antarctobacter heliothermus]|uniref:Putative thiamine transport system permease protein n=1 Tax=Antarctobacter heliothermus TaxID=74033 RepID=A0A239HXE2_9RHOB|nr:ABC transporter permease subunit [Antarctobacter heliothermus]SNS86017.1 putative thiamine transport system permease protein [Antarctobacter heliothermus]
MSHEGRLLRAGVLAVVGLGLITPIAIGLWQTGRAALGILPALGRNVASLDSWHELVALPGFATSLRLTLVTGLGSTLLSVLLATGFCAAVHARMTSASGARMLTPFLAIPHAAMAVGLAFVMAPSGWIARMMAPVAGWDRPPDFATVNDGWGLALTFGLMVKEVPFLLLVILSALSQIPVARQMAAGRALGYGRGIVWIKIIMPQVWPLIRLPVWVVLAYALSVVDMAIILGPSNPPTLAVAVTRWFTDADPTMILPASAGAILQAMIVGLAVALLLIAEKVGKRLGRWWIRRGGRGLSAEPGLWAASAVVMAMMAVGLLAMLSLVVWSLAWRWSFPQVLPESWSLKPWTNAQGGWMRALSTTLLLAGATAGLSLALAIAWLEGEDRARRSRAPWAEALIYLPLLIPQIGFLYGLNVGFLQIGLSGGITAVIWAQVLFVFPYVMIALSDPWRALDPRMIHAAAALGSGRGRRLWAVKLPVLIRPILTATAIGVAVSVAQYLPTLFMGAGRVATLTTEAVTLSSGSDRRVTGVYATLQAGLPFAAYLAALLIPAILHRNRRALSGASAT